MAESPQAPLPFDQLADRLTPQLQRYLERMVGEPNLAEDLLQETLVKIANGLPAFEGRSSLETWAYTIATRTATDYFRKPEVSARIVEVDDCDPIVDLEPDVGEKIVIDEMNSCIREVIDGLPADYRAALVLHDLQGMTAAETAEVCACSLATAKIRIHRARRRLQKALERECTFYQDRESVLRCDRKRPEDQ